MASLTRQSARVRGMVTVILLVVLFSWTPSPAQWSGHTSRQLQPATRGSCYDLMEVEALVFEMTNDVRRRNGLPGLIQEGICRDAARGHSADMLNRNYFSHADPEGRMVGERLPANPAIQQWGENIWTGSGHDPRQARLLAQKIMTGWMNSPGHRANILDPDYTHLGVGVMAKNQEIRATQVFIRMAAGGIRTGFQGR